MKRTLITSALPYANGYIHLGHVAGAYLPADIYARYLRLKGEELIYVCGSDEHGVAITIAADKEKVSPQNIIDKYHEKNKQAFEKLGMSFDIYSRTSLPKHHVTAREFFTDFFEKGYLVEREEEQFYDPDAKMFLPDRYIEGTCPNCGAENARGDQCDACGAYYEQTKLINPISLVSVKKPIVKKTNHWFFQFNRFNDFLNEYIAGKDKDWKENVIRQSKSWLKRGFTDRAITRDLSWGVKIDGLSGLSADKTNGKVLYVWFEAVLGYISATKYLMEELGNEDDWKKWWQNDDTRYIAFIGKDNIVFHTLIFPALLHARGNGYILPDNVPANEFLNLEKQKFSKSRNWSIDLKDFIEDFPDTSFMDTLRYTLAMNFPETRDSDFTWKDFQSRNNNELSAIFGNFVNRVLQFTHKNFDSKIPVLEGKYSDLDTKWNEYIDYLTINDIKELSLDNLPSGLKSYFNENDLLLIFSLFQSLQRIELNYDRFRFRDGLTETMNAARAANKYFNDEEPWKSIKSDKVKTAKTLYICARTIRTLAIIFSPVIPFSCEKVFDLLGLEKETGFANKGKKLSINLWQDSILTGLEMGRTFQQPSLLFSRIEDSTVEAQTARLGNKKEEAQSDLITIEDFQKVKLKTAKILRAEKVKKSKKLIKLVIDTGSDERQILAGVAEYYEPEYLVGKTIVVVANLQPAKLMGEESRGMMLAASTEDGKLCFITPAKEMPAGAEVR